VDISQQLYKTEPKNSTSHSVFSIGFLGVIREIVVGWLVSSEWSRFPHMGGLPLPVVFCIKKL
jgi:hypothetical protein